MASRIAAIKPGESPDGEVNELLEQATEGWWADANMFGVIARNPENLKTIVPVFVSFFANGKVEPHLHELMRLKTGQINDCAY